MKVKFYTNAAMEIVAGPHRILCDPWFMPGGFDGSWWQWPPLFTKPEDLTEYTHIYISHIHTDHCDPRVLRRLPKKDVPVIILKRSEQFLKNKIKSCGYNNFIEIEDRGTADLDKDTSITMYAAFTPNIFVEATEVPNVIDSSIVVRHKEEVVFNANDNVPDESSSKEIISRHQKIDLALLPYSGVGPFPSSYENLTAEEKIKGASVKIKKYLDQLLKNSGILKPRIIVPCAGQMILGGRQAPKNKTVGIPDPQAAVDLLTKNGFHSQLLEEGDWIDATTGKVEKSPRMNNTDKDEYIKKIAKEKYWWEKAFQIPPEEAIELIPLLMKARQNMWRFQEKYSFKADWLVSITVEEFPDSTYSFSLAENGTINKDLTAKLFAGEDKFLQVKIPYNYLIAILTRHCHWNNAYHGCQVEWYRKPDEYLPEIQTLLSYFHL